MICLPVIYSIFDDIKIAGYSLASIFEYWWIGLIVLVVAAAAIVGTYFMLAQVNGKQKFQPADEEVMKNYDGASKSEKKEIAKQATGPAKNVITWKQNAKWLIPTASATALVAALAVSFLPSTAFQNLMTTVSGSAVTIIDTKTSLEAAAEAEKNVVKIQEEGTVLLKNKRNTLPLAQDAKINIFGSCAYGLFYGNGGSGSFQTDGRVKTFPRTALKLEQAIKDEGMQINDNLFNLVKNYYSSNRRTVSVAPSDYDIQCGFNKYNYSEIVASKAPYDYELPVSAYNTPFDELGGKTALEQAKEYSDTALFVVTRRGSEDEDMNYSELKLKANEIATIEMLEENFEKVIILLNVPTVIESEFLDDDEIDAAIYMGHPGLTGTKAIAEVLCGKVNPSGHLVDTWPYDVKSAPSYQNFGNDTTLTHTGASTGKFTNYQEGIYVGYRYYTTRAMVDSNFKYKDEVQYSFGHGLSYTSFEKNIVEYTNDKDEQKISLTVSVKNTGSVAGKDLVQIYTHAPYVAGGVEKAWFSLSAFQKTNLLEPGATENYKLEFTYREIASWSTAKGCYSLDKGDYEFSLRENVWDLIGENVKTMNLAEDIDFTTSYQTGKKYENIFQDVEWGAGAEKIQYLSRNDFEGTWKNKADIDRTAVADKFPGGSKNQTGGREFTFQDNQIDEDLPVTGEDNGLKFNDFKNAAWDDPRWEKLLNQLSVKDLQDLVDQGSFKTAKIDSIGKAGTTDYDGPSAAFHSGTGHPSEVVVACSWDTDVARIQGESIGREGASRGLTGWYAPGINMHRSPFGGRNFEYYSEDPLIAGKMAGYTNQGTMKYGVYSYAKHFLLNEQENSRAGVFCWASEQAIREIYARGFEIYCDLGGIGIMSSFNCVGSWWAGGSKALLTTLLREEWGFHGVVVTDYAGPDYMATNIGLRAGNDLWLNKASFAAANTYSQTPHDATILMRRAAKNILYACAHSNNVWTLEDYKNVGIPEVNKTNS
ncbi:MAG: glycoside hydrolase family 3 C-terminal domain-containing protein [Bacilli bacterium]|nr:glycoside hydrolase family 3 C-terminal domain-containing protein [Bacilli bacterium]